MDEYCFKGSTNIVPLTIAEKLCDEGMLLQLCFCNYVQSHAHDLSSE